MRKSKLFSLILSIICIFCSSMLLLGCDGCNDGGDDENQVLFELASYKAELELGTEYQIVIKGGATAQVSYTSANENIATVNASGVVVAEAVGQTSIAVTMSDYTANLVVIVFDTGEVPHIVLNNVNDVGGLKVNVNNKYILDYTVIFKGQEIDSAVQVVSSDLTVASVNGDEITFNKIGNATITITATYKSWVVERTIDIEVVEDIYVYTNVNKVELSTSNVVGQQTNCTIDDVKVYKNKQEVSNPQIIWESLDNSVATVSNGTINAVGVGNTEVRVKYVENQIEYWAYVDVSVVDPYLSKPANLSFDEKTAILSWDEVDYADGYVVEVDGTPFEVQENSFDAGSYYGGTYFSVKAISEKSEVSESESVVLNYNIKSKNLTDYVVNVHEHLDATITREDKFYEEYGTAVYYADCQYVEPFNWNNDPTKYGYAFKKVYVIGKTASMGIADWCKTALISNKEPIAKYYGSSITLWVYSPNGMVMRYASSHVAGDKNEIIAQQTVPAEKWTKVSFTISRTDFPLVTFITASDDFYFTEVRISAFGYVSEDYSELPFFIGWDAQGYIDQVNEISLSDISLSHGELILKARNCFDALASDKKLTITGYSDFTARENKYYELVAEPFVQGIQDLPLINELTLEDRQDVESLRKTYESFISAVKNLTSVQNGLTKLVEYERKIKELNFKYVQQLITDLPDANDVTVYDEQDITVARKEYDALSNEEKTEIKFYDNLLDCERALEIALLNRLIEALPSKANVLSSDGDYIYKALIKYNSLSNTEKTKIENVQKLNELKTEFDTKYPYVRVLGESGIVSSALNVNHGLDYVTAKEEIDIITSSTKTANYDNSYVYNGEYGSLFKLKIMMNGSSHTDTNWVVIADFATVLSKMTELSAPYVKLYIYNNTADKEVIKFGDFDSLNSSAVLRSVNPGWNILTFTKEEIATINSLRSFICNSGDAPAEYWISDFFVANFTSENLGDRVFGESLMSTMLNVSSKDHLKADVEASLIGKYDFEKGLGIYAYEGDFGSLYKVTVNKVADNKFGSNWGVVVDFTKVLERMNADSATTATVYIYSNNEYTRWLMFGTHWASGLYGEYQPGWHAFTFTKEQIQSIIDAGSMICCDGASFETGVNTVEYWISDFFIDQTEIVLPEIPDEPNAYADGRVFGDKKITTSYAVPRTADHLKAEISVSVIESDSQQAGQGNYVYDGSYGKLAKVSITKGSGDLGKNWQASINFSQVKTAMEKTGATSVKWYVYSNNSRTFTIHVGTIWGGNSFWYEGFASGWHELTYTLADIEKIIADGGYIGSDNSVNDSNTTAEFWISDFFLQGVQQQ